jgi:hypothetical protein
MLLPARDHAPRAKDDIKINGLRPRAGGGKRA